MQRNSTTKRGLIYLFRLFFLSQEAVDRKTYALAGFGLALFKYAIDCGSVYWLTGHFWSPLNYLNPSLAAREADIGIIPDFVFVWFVVWTLSFLWIGVSMTFRRVINAGLPSWLGFLFFVPFVNYSLMLTLCFLPSTNNTRSLEVDASKQVIGAGLSSMLLGGLTAVIIVYFSIYVFGRYGYTVFLGAPCILGAITAYRYNRDIEMSFWKTFGVVQVTLFICAGFLLLFALEGIICLAMAYPIAMVLSICGIFIGRQLATRKLGNWTNSLCLLASLLLFTGADRVIERNAVHEVKSSIEIEASPNVVWDNVIGFSELGPPNRLFFRLGIAYPKNAKIVGSGVGAVRHCVFSTGAFVEPITEWSPGKKLAFDVVSQPPPMEEWSPYHHVHAPHLLEGLHVERGEFRIVPMGDGKTRLEGSTWYGLEMHPKIYWNTWSDYLIHAIHLRVLKHIKKNSEERYIEK